MAQVSIENLPEAEVSVSPYSLELAILEEKSNEAPIIS